MYDRADQLRSQTVSGLGSATFGYDRFGNLLSAPSDTNALTAYAYDAAGRLTLIDPPTGADVTFSLDPLDRKATRAIGGVTVDTYAYTGTSEVAWQTGETTPPTSLLDLDGSRLAVKTGGTVRWVVFDLHGSAVALCTAGTTTLTDAYRYDAWGELVASTGTSANPWRYRGLLELTGGVATSALYDMTARDYAPHLGVFTSWDTVAGSAAKPMTMNRYLYALANPATLIDPDGHEALEDECPYCHTAAPPTKSTTTKSKDESTKDAPSANTNTGVGEKDCPSCTHAGYTVDELRLLRAIAKWGDPAHWGKSVRPPCRDWAPEDYCREQEEIGGLMVLGLLEIASVAGAGVGAGTQGLALSRLSASGPRIAQLREMAARLATRTADDGVVYLRFDITGKLKPYVGQALSRTRFLERQVEHATAHPYADFEFTVLGRGSGKQLSRLEQYWIQRLGGPTNRSNPFGTLSNKRNEMNGLEYLLRGGDPPGLPSSSGWWWRP